MDTIVASARDIQFDIETALDMQLGAKPLPFPGMDSMYCTLLVVVLVVVLLLTSYLLS